MTCWEKFLTPQVEIDEEFNETHLTYQCSINHKIMRVYYNNDDKLEHQYVSNIAKAVLPVCLSCTRRQQDVHNGTNHSEDIGF